MITEYHEYIMRLLGWSIDYVAASTSANISYDEYGKLALKKLEHGSGDALSEVFDNSILIENSHVKLSYPAISVRRMVLSINTESVDWMVVAGLTLKVCLQL